MKVLVCLEHHFIQVGDQLYCSLLSSEFMQRYRDAWEQVVIFARSGTAAHAPPGVPPLNMQGVRIIALPDYLGLAQFCQHRGEIYRRARRALNEVDSIILRAPGTISTVIWSLVRRSGRPFGMEVIADPMDGLSRGATRHPLRPLIRWIFVRNLRQQCRQAFATAYVTRNSLQRRYPPGQSQFTTSYSDVQLDSESIVPRPRDVFSSNGCPRMIMVGTFAQMYKGHDIMLHALAYLKSKGLKFEMVFAGDGKHRLEMEQLARSLNLSAETSFLGEIPAGAPVLAELDRADLFVMPSKTEGLPRALIEAMSRGLPCVGTAVGGIPELLANEDLVPVNDAHLLGKKLFQVLQDPEHMRQMSQRNLQVAKQYRSEVMVAKRTEFHRTLRLGTEQWMANASR